MRIVIAGFGGIGQLHARLLAEDSRVELAGVIEPDAKRREDYRKRYRGTAFDSLDQALDTRPDALFITTPNVRHADAAVEALGRGVAVFCEKPMATGAADARRVCDAARKSGALFQVGHNRRFAPAYVAVRKIVDSGLRPYSVAIIKNDADLRSPAWSSDPAVTGGLLYDGTVHALDAALWLMGPATEVYCAARSNIYPDLDDLALTVRFASGALAGVTTCGHASALPPTERVAIYGDHAAVVIEDFDRLSYSPGADRPVIVEDFRQLPFERRGGYAQQDRAFVDALAGQEPAAQAAGAAAGAEEGRRVVELIEACYRSARENRPILIA